MGYWRGFTRFIGQVFQWIFDVLSGEILLRFAGNGGLVIFVRSALVAFELCLVGLCVKSLIAGVPDDGSWGQAIERLAIEHFEWFGALFAGSYAALYTRYSSQWSYLADLYNQIMSVKCQMDEKARSSDDLLIKWQVGFIADAYTLHLYRKDIFASVIHSLLMDSRILKEFNETQDEKEAKQIKKHVGLSEGKSIAK